MLSLIVSYSGYFGGAERLLLQCADGLEGERFLACPEGTLAERARAGELHVLPLRERPLDLRASARQRAAAPLRLGAHALEVHRLLGALRPDLLVGWGMRSAIACSAAASGPRRPPRVAFQHNDLLPGPAIARLVRAAARRSDRVVALSHAIARDLDPSDSLGERIEVCHPGVDLERFTASPPSERPAEVLLLGALVDWKRPELALEAVAAAAGEIPDIRLRVAGAPLDGDGGGLVERLRARASEPDLAGRVELAGPVDAGAALRRASCLLHCAEREPFGLVVLEALASGRPVVAPGAGGPSEVIDDRVGRLYEPGDPRAAAAALVEVLRDPALRARLGAQGRRHVEAHYALPAARERWRRAVVAEPPRQPAPRTGAGLALVTVTHDSEHELGRLLDSVGRHLTGAQVVVVDSGSSDRSAEVARDWAGGAAVLELGANVGFGAATNRGLASVTEPVTVILNPDIELVDDSLALLAREAGGGDRILAPLVLLPDGSRQDSVHPLPASAPDLVRALVPPAALPGALGMPLAPWRSNRPRRVGWAVGCCLVAGTGTFRRLGPFDERIFLYAEDLDLGLRAAATGVETWFWPAARVLHRRAHATEREFRGEPFGRLARERRKVIARRRGAGVARLDDAAQLATFASRLALKRLLLRPTAREARQLRAARDARREPLPPRERAGS